MIYIIFTFIFSFKAFGQACFETRLGFDIGSGSTKMMVAKVDICQKKILEILLKESRPVPYNEDLDKSNDGNLSTAIINKGFTVLSEMQTIAKKHNYKKSYGVATSVFRKAKNGTKVIAQFGKKLKIKLDVISQDEEALLGYLSVKSLIPEKNVMVWDIGGGSMQMFTIGDGKKPLMYLGDLASVTFKNMVIEVLQDKDLAITSSPNPIGEKREQIIKLARAYARLHVPAAIKSALKDRTVVGVGGVHSQSVKNQLGLKEMVYSIEELDKAAKMQSLKKDSELAGDYRSTDVTNLLLIQGFMEALAIPKVVIVDASLLQGVLVKH